MNTIQTYHVAVRYRTKHDGFFTRRYVIQAEDAATAKTRALVLAYRIRGSTMHEAEVTIA
jgi:hypothetical protein